LRDALRRQRIATRHDAHDRRAGEVKNNHRDHRGNEVKRLYRAKLARSRSLLEQFSELAKQGLEILPGNALQMWTTTTSGAHHLALYDPGIAGMVRYVIEVSAGIGQDLFARR